ncbi:prephenate dehydrogenase [Bombilactobacillus bombi]|uniref:prephenate dehydrogenase n=1 Tax=Bombilactobacillus bombi TaxID=1303590 RepID=UPI000E581836|nr:prephenate dehydrogenase [Bombilactobacillus bombi]AXX64785.1 prephenate dehydrogenase [Bombilactobacillus bombi]
MTKVLIKGLGLIGSSLALAIKQAHPTITLIGCDIDAASLSYAQQQNIIDISTTDFSTAAPQADVIILASPVNIIIKDLQLLATLTLKPHVLITDVGSTKQTIVKAAKPLQQQGIAFIGGHPMAGSHKSGVTAGRIDLFENAFYFLVPQLTSPQIIAQLQDLLSATHVKWLTVTPQQHDRIVGQLSHLPHIVAAGLVNETQTTLQNSPLGLRLAAGGFKTLTRIASSDPTMWTTILLENAPLISAQLQDYIAALSQIQTDLKNLNKPAIEQFFTNAKITRDHLGPQQLGSLPNFFDLFLNIPDQVGAIADVTQLLAKGHINLVNIHILEVREDIDGVLQLTFDNAKNQQQAANLLRAANYQIIRRN